MDFPEMPEGWARAGNLLYTGEQDGWRKGRPMWRNRLTVRVDGSHSSATEEEVEALTASLLAFLTAPTPSAALPVEGAGPGDGELVELQDGRQKLIDSLAERPASMPVVSASLYLDQTGYLLARLTAAETEAATLRDTLAGYAHDAAPAAKEFDGFSGDCHKCGAINWTEKGPEGCDLCVKTVHILAASPASVTAASVWVLQDRGNREVVGVYGSEAAARQAIEPDRDMKQYPDNPDYYHVEELPIESPASPASVTSPVEPALADKIAARDLCYALRELGLPEDGNTDNKARALILNALTTNRAAASIPVGGTPPSEWISVDERKPEEDADGSWPPYQRVLVARPKQYVKTGYFHNEGWYVEGEDYDGDDLLDNSVTHWQPLPAALSDGK